MQSSIYMIYYVLFEVYHKSYVLKQLVRVLKPVFEFPIDSFSVF